MINEMEQRCEADRRRFRKEGMPYFAWLLGDESRGIVRIGRWIDESDEYIPEERRTVHRMKRRNVTPNKMEKVVRTFGHRRHWVKVWLHLDGLPDEEAAMWRSAFPNAETEEG